MAVDADQRLWIGTFGGGLAMFDGLTWTHYTVANTSGGLISDSVRAVTAIGNTIWVGTPSGASAFSPASNQWSSYTSGDGLPGNDIRAIAVAGGNVAFGTLFGTWGNGLANCSSVLDINGDLDCIVNTKANSGLASDFIYDIAVGGNTQWIVTDSGVVCGSSSPLSARAVGESGSRLPTAPAVLRSTRPAALRWTLPTAASGLACRRGLFQLGGDTYPGVGACVFTTTTDTWRQFKTNNSGLGDNNVIDIAVDRQGQRLVRHCWQHRRGRLCLHLGRRRLLLAGLSHQ